VDSVDTEYWILGGDAGPANVRWATEGRRQQFMRYVRNLNRTIIVFSGYVPKRSTTHSGNQAIPR
jgi:hypothetical protein